MYIILNSVTPENKYGQIVCRKRIVKMYSQVIQLQI